MSKKKDTPRISVNKLAEYLEANAARRKKIVTDAKYPEKVIVTRYADARDAAKNYLINGQDEDYVIATIENLENKECDTDFQKQDAGLSKEALESFLEIDASVFDDCTVLSNDRGNELINISGVNISVNPDLIVLKPINDDMTYVGAIKLHVSKNNILNDESQKVVAMMLLKYVQDHLNDVDETESAKLCFSIDLFGKTIECCPTAIKLRMKRIEAACEEIALWWEKV